MEDYQNFIENMEKNLQLSWEVHRQAFGSIIEPAFSEDPSARLMLIKALNYISTRDIRNGMELLKEIRRFCTCDDDLAAWMFFVGVCFDMSGDKKHMIEWYEKAEKTGHRFYLPYMKLAKEYRNSASFEKAAKYYEISVECLMEMPEIDRDDAVVASAYTNMASCYTMLHMYNEAEKAWKSAMQYKLQPGSEAVAAVLYAAMGNEEHAKMYIDKLKKASSPLAEQTQRAVQQIIDGTHPDFKA